MHSKNVVHLDIKPANIMLQDRGEQGVVCKIGDFGMSTREGEVMDGHDGDTKVSGGGATIWRLKGERKLSLCMS
jgi:serine/threonine protein kinase